VAESAEKSPIFVAGGTGQVALSLREAAENAGFPLVAAGRPDFDLTSAASVRAAIDAYNPSAIINAAAYTAVDAAENDKEQAFAINATGAATLAAIAAERNIPFLHLSTDYVFDGNKASPYDETDAVGPTGVYGQSKLAGERTVLKANPKSLILRTAWVYSPYGKNFLKTMLSLSERNVLSVVADQHGNPTYAPDIAAALLAILARLDGQEPTDTQAGIYHMTGSGETTWHGFASQIFDEGARFGLARPEVKAIPTADYPTPAKRPANSRLNCEKLSKNFNISLPGWRESTALCVKRLSEMGQLG